MGSILPNPSHLYQSTSHSAQPIVKEASGIYIILQNGQKIIDSTCGAAVSSIGHNDPRVKKAMIEQLDIITYAHPGYFQNVPALELADLLVKTTGGKMSRACLVGSVSEAMEVALKLARSYYLERFPKSKRINFIARRNSWHGCTLGALAVGDFSGRKAPFVDLLSSNVSHVSACHPYRGLRENESEHDYVLRLKAELDAEFLRLGPDTVAAFVVEPVVGTALGCVIPATGYLKAVKEICDRHGALLIFDEVMCCLGRTGSYHAWQQDNVVPDIQAVGKGLGGGYATISAVLFNDRVIDGLEFGSGTFQHGQTYQCHPLSCATALAVQRVIQEDAMIEKARENGEYLGQLLAEHFSNRPYVGDVRGRGLFWCVEFVADKQSKEPFKPSLNIAKRLRLRGLEPGFDVCLFSSSGCADGYKGDHFLLAPPFIATPAELEEIVIRAGKVVDSVFAEIRMERMKMRERSGMNGWL